MPVSQRGAGAKRIASSDDEAPIIKKPKSNGNSVKSRAKSSVVKDESDISEPPTPKKPKIKAERSTQSSSTTSKSKRSTAPISSKADGAKKAKSAKANAKKEEDLVPISDSENKANGATNSDDEEDYKWWEEDMLEASKDNTVKWETLEHNGVFFAPPYEPLPKHVKMLYDGQEVDLPVESEEVAGFFGAMLETDHAKDATFQKNFFEDFAAVCKRHPPKNGIKITTFDLCDFRPMYEYFSRQRDLKKAMSAAEKKAIKLAREEREAPFMTCTWNGRKEKVGNFRIEPPSLFRGRGEHPKKGRLKTRILAEDVTLNLSRDAAVPAPPEGHQWGSIQHDNTVTWLAMWKENINSNHKYVMLAPGSSIKGQSDYDKFQKARELKNHIDRIRRDYQTDLSSKIMAERQRATAMYFIDQLALRAGNEKGADEADTVGCCSLRFEHVTLEPPNFLVFDFPGKDSVRYFNKVEVSEQVFKNIKIFKKAPKGPGDDLFDRLTTSIVNKHLLSYQKGLTAKVFRTYNASITMQEQLKIMTPAKGTTAEKVLAYNRANAAVAVLCNHKKGITLNHGAQMEKAVNKIRALKYQRRRLRHGLWTLDPKHKKLKAYQEFLEDESDVDSDWIVEHEILTKEIEIQKAQVKFQRDNEKRASQDPPAEPLDAKELKARLKEIDLKYVGLEKERKTHKIELKASQTADKLVQSIRAIESKIDRAKNESIYKQEGAEVSLGTSKTNYISPQIVVAWSKAHEVPLERLYPKTLLTKFQWAFATPPDFEF